MTEKIQQTISAIRLKTFQMHTQLVASVEQNMLLVNENQSLNAQIELLKQAVKAYEVQLSNLEVQLVATKEQVVITPVSHSKKEEEIDELVKEIEYCISQLKK